MTRRVLLSSFFISTALGLAATAYTHWRHNQAVTAGEVLPEPSDRDPGSRVATPDKPIAQDLMEAASKPAVSALHQALKQSPLAPMLSESSPGRFQVYRQGNLTWRIDTASGESCVLLATHAEWRKPQVYQNGCNSKTDTDR
jgi:hypothetical protein